MVNDPIKFLDTLDKINTKEKAWLANFFQHYNRTKASLSIGLKGQYASTYGSNFVKKPKIQEVIRKYEAYLANTTEITIEELAKRLNTLSKNAKRDSDKIKATEILLRMKIDEQKPADTGMNEGVEQLLVIAQKIVKSSTDSN